MGWFILFIILMLVAAGLVIGAFVSTDSGGKAGLAGGAVLAVIVGFLLFFLGTIREVPVHSDGVATSAGKVEGDLRPGLHWFIAPWTQVHILDETIQTSTFRGTGKSGSCMQVRIFGQQLACANIVLKWQIEDQAAPALFNNYDNNGTTVQASITKNLVLNDLYTVANQVFGSYNPIEDAQLTAQTTGNATTPVLDQFSTFGPEILAKMRADLKGQIAILAVNLSNAYYSNATETRLASVANQFADTAAAQQQIQTDTQLAAANNKLAASLTPALVQYQCLTSTADIYKSGKTMNAGWSCFGSAAVVAGK